MAIAVEVRGPVVTTAKLFRTPLNTVPGVDTNIYTSGDALGTKMTFSVPREGIVQGIIAVDLAKQSVTFDVVMFNGDFVGGVNNDAFDMTDSNFSRLVGIAQVSTYFAFNDNSVAVEKDVGLRYLLPEGGLLWVQCVTRGTPTLAAVGDIKLGFVIEVAE